MIALLTKLAPGLYGLRLQDSPDKQVECCVCVRELRRVTNKSANPAAYFSGALLCELPHDVRAMLGGMELGEAIEISDYGTAHATGRWAIEAIGWRHDAGIN